MQSKDILAGAKANSKNPVLNWAVANPFAHVYRNYKTMEKMRRRDALKVQLVSTEMYEYRWSRNETDAASFSLAPEGCRDKAFLVTDGTNFYTLKSGEFVGDWDVLEARWLEEEAAQRESAAAEQIAAEKREKVLATSRVRAVDLAMSLERNVRSLLGEEAVKDNATRIYVSGDAEKREDGNYDEALTGYVTLSVQQFQRLLEKVYEAQDN